MNLLSIKLKEKRLDNWFKKQKGVIIAFSGGVDSALVLFYAKKVLGKACVLGVISKSESLKTNDYQVAIDFAGDFDIDLKTVHTEELQDPRYVLNNELRCYYCKTHLYNELQNISKHFPDYTIVNGSNADDQSDYRPGQKAAIEKGIQSPLADCGFTKEEIRTLAKKYKLPVWNKPASPCLSSRIPYGNEVNLEKLRQIEKAEEILNHFGYDEVRVRHYGVKCKIEVPFPQIDTLQKQFDEIAELIKTETGFKKCILDEEGLVSGKLNRVLSVSNG